MKNIGKQLESEKCGMIRMGRLFPWLGLSVTNDHSSRRRLSLGGRFLPVVVCAGAGFFLLGRSGAAGISDSQKRVLEGVKSYQIKKDIECPNESAGARAVSSVEYFAEELLSQAGWQATNSSLPGASDHCVLSLGFSGRAISQKYGVYGIGSGSEHWSGAEVSLHATLRLGDGQEIGLGSGKGYVSPPGSIQMWAYSVPGAAPFSEAYEKCEESFKGMFVENLIGVIYDAKGVGPLVKCLDVLRFPASVRLKLLRKIGSSQNKDAVPLLVPKLLEDESGWDDLRGAVASALGELGDARAVEPLCAVLRGRDGTISPGVVQALDKIGDPRAVPFLSGALRSVDPAEHCLANTYLRGALEHFKWKPESIEDRIYWYLLQDNEKEIITLQPAEQAANALCALLVNTNKPSTVSAVIPLLGHFGTQSAVEGLSLLICSSAPDRMKVEALKSLGTLGSLDSLRHLSNVLSNAGLSSTVREECASVLGGVGGSNAVMALCSCLDSEREEGMIRSLVVALGQTKAADSVPTLCRFLGSDSLRVRGDVVEALGKIRSPRAVQPLKDRLSVETDEDLRGEISAVIQRSGGRADELPFADALRLMGENKKWDELLAYLEKHSTLEVVEALKVRDSLVKKAARLILVKRTKNHNLGDGYEEWSRWMEKAGGQK